MKRLLVSLVAILAASSAAATVEIRRETLVDEVARLIGRSLDRDVLVRMAVAEYDRSIEGPAREAVMEAVQAFYRSHDFESAVIRPWVDETFTDAELAETIAFLRSSAGRKLHTRTAPATLVARAQRQLETDMGQLLRGTAAEDLVRLAAIKQTAADIRTLATALEAFAVDNNRYPVVPNVAGLEALISPTYIRKMPEKDAWDRPLEYTSDGRHYRITSGGADGIVQARGSSFDPAPSEVLLEEDATGDVVYQDGRFLVVPRGMAPAKPHPFRGQSVSGKMRAPVEAPREVPGFERVGGDVRAATPVQRVEPVYPADARAARIAGIVIMEVLIDARGNVVDATVLKPLPYGLDQAALDAVRQWKFAPGTKNGVAVPVAMNMTINFKLE